MGSIGIAAVDLDDDDGEEEEKKKRTEVDRLPPLLEDEENVSLADILCLRDCGLSEQELWAVCVECIYSLQNIALLPLYRSLCVTPDTLAFNAHGNVCFMEQLNDDPDGCFIPPEFERTGNTFEGHMFSLGSTLSAALDYITDVELQVELSPEGRCLLKQMQMEKPEDRPQLQDVLSRAEVVLGDVSPTDICRKLSAIGRRVLSIESLAAFQDGCEKSRHHFLEPKSSRSNSVENHAIDRVIIRNLSSDSYDGEEWLVKRSGLVCNGSSWSGCSTEPSPDSRSQNSSPVHRKSQGRSPGRARKALNRSCSVPDSNNPPAFCPSSYAPISMLVADLADLSEITEEEDVVNSWNGKTHRVTIKQISTDSESDSGKEESGVPSLDPADRSPEPEVHKNVQSDNSDKQTGSQLEEEEICADVELGGSNHMTRSMLCLNVDFQNEWISLRGMLSQSSQPFSVNELWALCYMCLSTLQTYIDLPDYLCLDSVYVGCEGDMLFLRPKHTVSCDSFFLAPEYQEHGIATEKACVYGVAAILWTTAKFNLSQNEKLAMPRKLKRLLLEMARKTPIERPSIETVKKCCCDYLSRRGTNADMVWVQLISRFQQAFNGTRGTEEASSPECAENTSDPHLGEDPTGFVPLASEGRLVPVIGPVPHINPSISTNITLPEAFTSSATHFSPIVLTQEQKTLTDPESDRVESFQEVSDFEDDEAGKDFSKTDWYSSSSSSKTLLNSPPPAAPQTTEGQSDFLTLPCDHGICNNFLLHQDPRTGHLTLLPVQITVPQPITGLDPLSEQLLNKKFTKLSFRQADDNITNKSGSDTDQDSSVSPERSHQRKNSKAQSIKHAAPSQSSCLQQLIDLLRAEFVFDGYLENGVEDVAMADFIFSLKNLQFEIFCEVITEKFSDLYWSQEFLYVLYCLIHHQSCLLGSAQQCSLHAVKRGSVSLQCVRCSYTSQENGLLYHSNTLCSTQPSAHPAPQENLQKIKTPNTLKIRETVDECEPKETVFGSRNAFGRQDIQEMISETLQYDSQDVNEQGSSILMAQFSTDPEGGAGEFVSGAETLWHSGELEEGRSHQFTPECSVTDMDDSDSLMSDRTFSINMDPRGSAWALALYGEDCFNQDVKNYAQKLSSHCKSPTLEEKSQELHQQLVIESRNLKKTRNFYYKLINQEKRNKGSETKVMMSKIKLQFDELRTKVEFLHSVKQYLKVLSVDQWGLSLLSSLAICEAAPLHLQSTTEDPSVLTLICEERRGKCCPLMNATAKGLMAYLYARNAYADGYIQQFFYTYRYFCTSEELLEFLMNKFNNTLGSNEDLSSDCKKVHQRTLDLLHFWIGDAQLMDFTSSSNLLHTLNSFLTSKVAPVDSRGESLLSLLQTTPKKRRVYGLSCVGDASISSLEEWSSTNSLCRKSSIDDAARKNFQWCIANRQTAQSKEKMFSIAAALPRPCYASIMTEPRSEDTLTFSQTQHTSIHTAQQLTLLEQEIFQDCHPVHFLNSRTHGVTEKSGNISRCLSVEGSSLFVQDGPLQDGAIHRLISYADSVSNWVSAELVICDSVKDQTALLTRFLAIGKFCYEIRNFATAMQILSGLENVIVRQLPGWKSLSGKVCGILEELRAVQVFLKSDNLCLMEGQRMSVRPTLPAAQILALHLQQLEIGAFTTTSGSYKWTKLRNIARVVSQVHAFQEHLYSYPPDLELQSYLRGRIARLGKCDVPLLASDNDANFNQTAIDRHGRRIHDTLRRVKASFQ
ncbi:kinase non-catalytic C-lobe domain-containing protein 1 isoform X2 [Paramisgurnus dabryanus]|uniref:kinase non-catalytic C-lobe domain-containing protein 1 isoform X2 n=1 Tax=Paramisgurnus dabryanus TaxID=90735 RepID=UPI0031F33FF8